MLVILLKNIIYACFFDALIATPCAIFSEFNGGIFANGLKSGWSQRCFNIIFFGHASPY